MFLSSIIHTDIFIIDSTWQYSWLFERLFIECSQQKHLLCFHLPVPWLPPCYAALESPADQAVTKDKKKKKKKSKAKGRLLFLRSPFDMFMLHVFVVTTSMSSASLEISRPPRDSVTKTSFDLLWSITPHFFPPRFSFSFILKWPSKIDGTLKSSYFHFSLSELSMQESVLWSLTLQSVYDHDHHHHCSLHHRCWFWARKREHIGSNLVVDHRTI